MAAKKTAASPSREVVQQVVDKWYADNMHNSVVSRDVDVHNLIHNAKSSLVDDLVAALGQPTTSE